MAAHAYSVVDYGNLAKIVPEVVGRTEFKLTILKIACPMDWPQCF